MIKFISVLTGLLAALFSIMFLAQLVQLVAAKIITGNASFYFNGFIPDISIDFTALSIITAVLLSIIPLLFVVFTIELLTFALGKVQNEFIRMSTIVYLIFSSGYLIFNALVGFISVLFNTRIATDWSILIINSGLSRNGKLILLLLILILLFGYLNLSTKRMKKFIPVINLNQRKGNEQTTK